MKKYAAWAGRRWGLHTLLYPLRVPYENGVSPQTIQAMALCFPPSATPVYNSASWVSHYYGHCDVYHVLFSKLNMLQTKSSL